MGTVDAVMNQLFRREAGKLVSFLTGVVGPSRIEIAEDAVQEALVAGLQEWRIKGVPENPSAWLYVVAKRKALDAVRRLNRQDGLDEGILGSLIATGATESDSEDDELRMMFVCAHPELGAESQVAVILKSICGFGAGEIAKAFLLNTATIEKRIYRAKQFFKEKRVGFELPEGEALTQRLDSVLTALYLMFNEGYASHQSAGYINEDVMEEAMRLMMMLVRHEATAQPPTFALLALMCFHAARLPARLSGEKILVLRVQDRGLWSAPLIRQGVEFFDRSIGGDLVSRFHLEAAIAKEHCIARTFEETDWAAIVRLYDLLAGIDPSPVVMLNRAIAVAAGQGAAAGLAAVFAIPGLNFLAEYYLLHATLGEFYGALGERTKAVAAFEKAISLTDAAAEKALLRGKIGAMLVVN